MIYVKILKFGYPDFVLYNVKDLYFNKKLNEYGQFEVITNLTDNTNKKINIGDYIEAWNGDTRICTGYVYNLNYKNYELTVQCFTEEYKLESAILPSDYTINTSGLTLNSLAEILTRNYWQIRWNGKYDFQDSNKIKPYPTSESEVILDENIYLESTEYDPGNSNDYLYELKEYNVENGKIGYFSYDRTAIIDIYGGYYESAQPSDILATLNPRNKTIIDNFLPSEITVKNGTSEWTIFKISGGNVYGAKDIIVHYEVLGGRGTKIKLYLNSTDPDYTGFLGSFERALTRKYDYRGIYYPTGPEAETVCMYVTHKGSKKQNGERLTSGWLNLSTGIYADFKLDRVRIAEPYINYGERAIVTGIENYATNTLIGSFANTSGTYDSGEIPLTTSDGTVFGEPYPNENTEIAGFYFGGQNEEDYDFYFSFISNIYNIVSPDDTSYLVRLNDKFYSSIALKGIEFVIFKNYLDDFTVDSDIQDLYPAQFEMDRNTNYEVLQSICKELDVYFYVEDNELYIKKKNVTGLNEYTFKDGINCKVNSINISDENAYNIYEIEGEGDTPISKPLRNPRLLYAGNINKGKIIKSTSTTKQELVDDVLDDVYFDYTNWEEVYENKTVGITFSVINYSSILKTGDKVNISTSIPNNFFKDLYIEEANYKYRNGAFIQEITVGNARKNLT